jgi:hypothetical protein
MWYSKNVLLKLIKNFRLSNHDFRPSTSIFNPRLSTLNLDFWVSTSTYDPRHSTTTQTRLKQQALVKIFEHGANVDHSYTIQENCKTYKSQIVM